VIIAIPLLVVALDLRPSSFRSSFAHDRDMLLARSVRPAPLVTEADLTLLRPLMQTYQASVSLDGHERGKTLLTLGVSPGQHLLLLRHPDSIDEQRQLSVAGDTKLDVSLWRRRPTAAQLPPAYPGLSISGACTVFDEQSCASRLRARLLLPATWCGGLRARSSRGQLKRGHVRSALLNC
jgi:hypothetical protein